MKYNSDKVNIENFEITVYIQENNSRKKIPFIIFKELVKGTVIVISVEPPFKKEAQLN